MDTQNSILYYWHASEKNPHYAENLTAVRRESCHTAHNVLRTNLYISNSQPRRRTWFRGEDLEVLDKYGFPEYVYMETDSNRQNACRMNHRLMNFASIVNTGWKKKEFSVVFLTLSFPEYNKGIRHFLKVYKQNLNRNGVVVFAHCWVLELGKKGNNPHYHVCFATPRTKNLKQFFPDDYWVGRVETSFVKKDCVRYMSKYLQKGDNLVQNWRRFGVSSLKSKVKYSDQTYLNYIGTVYEKYKLPIKLKKGITLKV